MSEQRRRSTDRLESRLEFETLISDLSSSFINLPSAEVDDAIQDALSRVCEFLDIDQAILWQWSIEEPDVIRPTHYYPVLEGVEPPSPMREEHFPWLRRKMVEGRTVVLSTLDDFPPEGAVDREWGLRFGVKSNLSIPLSVGREVPVGALGLNALRAERAWPDAVVKRLELVAQVFANALARRRYESTLRESEARLSLAADSAEAGLWTLDYGSGVFWATERARAIFGYSPDEVLTLARLEASIHPEDRARIRELIDRTRDEQLPIDEEYRIVTSDGEVRWIASRARPQFSAAGEPDRLMGLSIDVTERRRAEEASRAMEARLAAAADLAGLGFYEVDFSEGVAYADSRFCEICGMPDDEMEGLRPWQFWHDHLHPDDRPRILDVRERLYRGELENAIVEYRFLNPVRGEIWIHQDANVKRRDADGRMDVSFGVVRDITERKRAEESLHDLSRRLIRAQEEERAMIARELHDDLTQRLAVLAIDAGRVELASLDGSLADTMRSIRDGLVRLSEDVHALAYQLHPSVLEELGLAEALRTECERSGRRNGVTISLDLDLLPASPGRDAALCLFRVAQESLNNVIRHSGARNAIVSLRQMDGGLLLAVRDDGVGFDPHSPKKARSLGLVGMLERVKLVDGTLDIESAPGQGTAVIAWVPVEGDAS